MHEFALDSFLIWYAVFLFSVTVHEAAHALAAKLGGDPTAYRGGQVTLNPVPHVKREPVGTVVIPFLSYAFSGSMMGWASAPYDPYWGRRYPRRLAAMSAAGPAANLILAILAFGTMKALLATGFFAAPETANFDHMVAVAGDAGGGGMLRVLGFGLSITLYLNLLLFVLNMIPIPPLDGASIAAGLDPKTAGRWIGQLTANPIAMLIGLIIAWKLVDWLQKPMFDVLLALLHPGTSYR